MEVHGSTRLPCQVSQVTQSRMHALLCGISRSVWHATVLSRHMIHGGQPNASGIRVGPGMPLPSVIFASSVMLSSASSASQNSLKMTTLHVILVPSLIPNDKARRTYAVLWLCLREGAGSPRRTTRGPAHTSAGPRGEAEGGGPLTRTAKDGHRPPFQPKWVREVPRSHTQPARGSRKLI